MSDLAGVFFFDSRPAAADSAPVQWGGRLDDPVSSLSAASLALDLYRGRGIAGLSGLVGDWSLAIRDADTQSVVLASDFAGIRPLYYYRDAERLLWSSSLTDLQRASGASELDDGWVASFLSLSGAGGQTPYRGIRAVPAGCAVRAASGGSRIERFWDLPVGREILLSGKGDYEERLLQLFRDAVAARVRPHAHVVAELSGGLDSSSIACMAARLGAPLTTISYLHEGAMDERYIRAVEEAVRIPAIHLDLAECPFVSPEHTGGSAPGWWEARYRRVARQMESIAATALLTGQLGDLVMGNTLDDSGQVAGYLRRLRLRDAGREAYAWSQALRIPIYPILWRAARLCLSRWAPPADSDLTPTAWERRATANSLSVRLRRTGPKAVDGPPDLNWRKAPPDRRRRFRALAEMLSSRRLETPEALQSISYSHPFAHRPLVEFMLSIPPAEVCRPGEPRRLMRRAFAGLLPEAVLRRKSKAAFGGAYDRCLAPMAAEMLAHSAAIRCVERGYVDRASLLDRLEKFEKGLDCNLGQLRVLILFEFWLRSLPR